MSILVRDLEAACQGIDQGFEFLLSYFSQDEITSPGLSLSQTPFTQIKNFLERAQADLEVFQDWLQYQEICSQLESLGAGRLLLVLRESDIPSDLWFPMLEKRLYQLCLESILFRKPELKNFRLEAHQKQIQEFAALDTQQLNLARDRVRQLHAKRWRTWQYESESQPELQLLQTQTQRRRGHLPIRKLLSKIPGLVKSLKPCWMMSPLSVSQYVDPETIHFDVLIFDEASQIRTEDVVPSIMRSDQVVVIGDNKQLPPTSFFLTGTDDDLDEDEEDASYESVLDECSVFMTNRTLKWHYRSLDERLIAFSNRHFYGSQLVTFPNPVQDPNLGINFHHVPDGIFDRGGSRNNKREAEIVAQLALEHVHQSPNLSLGIIAFSEAQADAIRDQLDLLSNNYLELEAFCRDRSRFFLKSLENVQGDEGDAILLSVGYAPDAQGVFHYNFGPLNKQGGERRLNVAITRAKRRITVVSSIQASDLDLGQTQSKAVAVPLLKDYLAYAASGGEIPEGNRYSNILQFDSPFEEDVYLALTEKGYTVRTQVGCSAYRIDLAVVDDQRPGEFLLGIECDGASYHSSPTARDRDRLREKVLVQLGWRIHRIWSTEWFRDKPAQLNLLVQKLEDLPHS